MSVQDWQQIKLKYVAQINPKKTELLTVDDLEVTFLPMENILGSGDIDLSITKLLKEVYDGYTYFRENDVVLAKVTPCFENGNIAIMKGLTNGIGFGTTELHVVRTNECNVNNKFIYYALQSDDFKKEAISNMYGVGGLKRIPTDFVKNYEFRIPQIQVQRQVVKFLNKKINDIQQLIKEKEALIILLKEKRQSIITEAVTKGLNSNVKMKDSGVEWIGEIPEHWEKTRLDFVTKVKARLGWKGLKAEEYVDEGYIFLATPNLKTRFIDFEHVNYITEERYLESPEIMLQKGDVLLAKDGSTLGITNVVRELPAKATVNSSIAVIRPKEDIDSVFIYYYLSSTYIQDIINQIKDGMGVPHLFQADIKKFAIILPPLSEQKEISEYLDEKVNILDCLIDSIKKQIQKLKEYRQSLIYEAVTGKIDVRDFEVVS